MNLKIRPAGISDAALVLSFIKELAEYEHMLDEVTATVDDIRRSIFVKGQAHVIFGEVDDTPVSFALYFHNYSTFSGKHGLYLEDLYVKHEWRGKGIGSRMFSYLAQLAIRTDCSSFRWWCLDWNKLSIGFYKKMGAEPMSNWTVYVVRGQALHDLAERQPPHKKDT